ncbi:hypothetical protein EW145_g5716 [Phellinidium pouzarii]|uniref:Carboxymuconolactone decarboxylase-like domain-containing protein n=1 Tax=Phellinidium pouzarii TaxID=167371 RepID=A0A4S4KZ30_9AGAM|nr:hypothetical protein EW145_g5716 [Phellinidium pouzarii]
MPRIPYVFPPRAESEIADKIRLRRKDEELTDLDGMILNAPKIAEGYDMLLKAIRTLNSLPDDVRELIILRVAALNSAAYEWIQHEPLATKAGLNSAQLAMIRDVSTVPASARALNAPSNSIAGFSDIQAAALEYTDYMTRSVAVPQDVFDSLRANLENDQQVFEATATVATYNMVSRMLMALDVADKASEEVPKKSPSET